MGFAETRIAPLSGMPDTIFNDKTYMPSLAQIPY